jgi:hypothetical protein
MDPWLAMDLFPKFEAYSPINAAASIPLKAGEWELRICPF